MVLVAASDVPHRRPKEKAYSLPAFASKADMKEKGTTDEKLIVVGREFSHCVGKFFRDIKGKLIDGFDGAQLARRSLPSPDVVDDA